MNINNYIKYHYKDALHVARLAGANVYNNEFTKLVNLKYIRSITSKHVRIQDLFREYWPSFKLKYGDKLRPSIIKNVEAMINCRDLTKGYLFYECPNCDNFHLTGLSCNSRFCPSCGHRYRDERALAIKSKLLDVPHRHFVFSVSYDLRPFFWKCRNLFDVLFQSVNEALHLSITKSSLDKKLDRRLGFAAFLHTSGRSLNCHPHLHVLIAEATVDKHGNMKRLFFFPFERLRKTFMFRFINNMSKCLKDFGDKSLYNNFQRLRNFISKKYEEGFYTYGPKIKEEEKFDSTDETAKYLARYASHPPIAESNLLSLDSETNEITWKYTPHDGDGTPEIIKEHPHNLIKRLIRHILDEGFHQIRYYGFYSNRTDRAKKLTKKTNYFHRNKLKSNLTWHKMIMRCFKYDPILCQCGHKMILNWEYSYLPTYKNEKRNIDYG